MRPVLLTVAASMFLGMIAGPSLGQLGGFRSVPLDDKALVAAVNFAIAEKSKTEKVSLLKILKAESQVVAGRNFRFEMDVRVGAGVRKAKAVVWAKLDRTHQLSKWDWLGDATPGEKSAGKPFPGKVSKWNGFERHDFQIDGAGVIVVVPEKALPGKPWAWRGEFFGAFPNADIELVKAGWHLAYIGVPNLFGAPNAMAKWEKLHDALVNEHGLHAKPALIGLSRGALYCMAWAAKHPDKTMLVYLDNGVCDFKSWPGGKVTGTGVGPGSAGEWKNVLKAFDFNNDAEAFAYKGNPVDNLESLAKAKLPMLLVYGDSDKVVPHKENSEIVFKRYRAMGGPVEQIIKAGGDHHPHGLPDPRPIVQFFEKVRTGQK